MGGQVVVYYAVLLITAIAAYWRGNLTDRAGVCIAILGSALTSAFSTVNVWGDFAYPFFIIDLGVLIGFWSLALFSSRFWPYWATGWQLVGTLVHVQRGLFDDILEKPYGLLSMYIAYPILGVILIASLMKNRTSTNILVAPP